MRVAAFLAYAFRRFPLLLSATTALLLAVGILEALALLSIAPLVDAVLGRDAAEFSDVSRRVADGLRAIGLSASLGTLLAVFLGINVAKAAVQAASMYAIVRSKYALLRDLMRGTFEDCLGARWEYFTSRDQGALLNLFTRELITVGDAFGGLARFVAGVIQLTLYLAVPFYVSWQMTTMSIAAALVLAMPFMALGRVNYRLGQLDVDATNALTAVFHETFAAIKVVLAFASQQQSVRRFADAFETHRRISVRWQTLSRSIPPLYYPIGLTVVVLALLAARSLGVPLSEMAVVMYALLRVIPSLGVLAEEKNTLDHFIASHEHVQKEREAARQARQPSGSRPFGGFSREIAFEGVSFAHAARPATLTNIDLRIPRGAMVAVVGESGAGKSTLVDLLMGLYTPQAGRITIDGIPLSELDMDSYRRAIGYVPQESVLFNMSIGDNIRWGREDATEEDIVSAARLANAANFIDELPEGYGTLVGDRGVRLSGGQVQRIALARAIVRRPAVLVLDEATSALDSLSERLFQDAIETIARQATVVAIAHRLSTILKADYIYVLSRGRVAEHGSYAVLSQAGGLFSRMIGLQTLEAPQ